MRQIIEIKMSEIFRIRCLSVECNLMLIEFDGQGNNCIFLDDCSIHIDGDREIVHITNNRKYFDE